MSQASPLRSVDAVDGAFVAHDPAFREVLGDAPRLERVVETDAHEGLVYVPDEDALYFTSVPVEREGAGPLVAIRRLELGSGRVSVVREDAGAANGMTLDREGRLVVCEQGTRSQPAAITRLDRGRGSVETVVDEWAGLPFNSPNDVVVASDGAVWFTDPSYGHLQGFRPEPQVGDFVFRHDPVSSRIEVVADSFDKPNGLAFSPDESVLYVTDSGANQGPGSYHVERPHHVKAFDVVGGRRLVGERLFAVITPGFPDGIKVDTAGRVYSSAASGVQVFAPSGDPVGEIRLPGAVNFTFGGPDPSVLYITTDDAVWAAFLQATGPPQLKGA